jgi:hypothetical protein
MVRIVRPSPRFPAYLLFYPYGTTTIGRGNAVTGNLSFITPPAEYRRGSGLGVESEHAGARADVDGIGGGAERYGVTGARRWIKFHAPPFDTRCTMLDDELNRGYRMSGSEQSTTSFVVTPFVTGGAVELTKAIAGDEYGNSLSVLIEVITDGQETRGNWLNNPHFAANGHDGSSPNTAKYFLVKKSAMVAGSIVGAFDPTGGGVNVATGAFNTYAARLMWTKISGLFEQMITRRGMGAKPPVYASWYSWTVAKKAVPPGSLETQMRAIIKQKMWGAASGVGKMGTGAGGVAASTMLTPFIGQVVGYFINSVGGLAGKALDKVFGQDTQTLAQGLHWMAFRENVVGRGTAIGPSLRILELLWTELAVGKASGITLRQVVAEPKGWLVIADLVA